MSTGRISPVLCSFTHSSLSLAGSTFRSNWSTSSTVWNEENKNPNVKAHFRQSHCSDMQSSCGHANTASADKWELHVHETGWTRQVWMCSLVVSREEGDLTWRSRDRFPVPGSSQAASDSCPAICTLHQTQLYWVCMHPILYYLINSQLLTRKRNIYIHTSFSNSETIQYLPSTNRGPQGVMHHAERTKNSSCWPNVLLLVVSPSGKSCDPGVWNVISESCRSRTAGRHHSTAAD